MVVEEIVAKAIAALPYKKNLMEEIVTTEQEESHGGGVGGASRGPM